MKRLLFLLPLFSSAAFAQTPEIPDDKYVQVKNGHLFLEGQRVRYWGLIGYARAYDKITAKREQEDAATRAANLKKARANLDLMVGRIETMGFNLVRNWDGGALAQGENPATFEKGDGSPADLRAYYLWKLDQKGIKVWESSFNGLGEVSAADVEAVSDPATAPAWREAMTQSGPMKLSNNLARAWDARIAAVALRRMKRYADFRNPYKNNLRWGDDPQVVTWELTNEEIWLRKMVAGGWQKLPMFFQNSLRERWNEFLKQKYRDDAGLQTAWKFLLEGESLGQNSVQLLPMQGVGVSLAGLNDTNPEAVKKFVGQAQKWGRADFVRQRPSDVLEFLTGMWVAYKKREEAEVEKWGKSCRLTPTILDSYNPFQIQSNFLHQQGDVSATCTYVKGMGHDPTDEDFPFYSGLKEFPRMAWDAPWLEQSKIPGKPLFVYETQIDNRTKFRADYPYRMATALSLLDGDIVNWHDYGNFDADASREKPFEDKLHIWHDHFHYAADEVQQSAMKAASEAFRGFHIAPAPHPTTFIFGRRALYDPASMDYGGSFGPNGKNIMSTLYRYGAQVWVDPAREDNEVRGPMVKLGIYQPNPVRPHGGVEYDWRRGFLKLDAPGNMTFAGFWAKVPGDRLRFQNGLQIRRVEVQNPPKMPFPVRENEKYVAISLVSRDGLPLSQSQSALVSAVSTSFNSGYGLNLNQPWRQDRQKSPGPLPEFFGAQESAIGDKPVLVARVGAVLEGAVLRGFRWTLRGFGGEELGRGEVKNNQLIIPSGQPIWFIELER